MPHQESIIEIWKGKIPWTRQLINESVKSDMVAHVFILSNWREIAGVSLKSRPVWSTESFPGQPSLHRGILSWKTQQTNKNQTKQSMNKRKDLFDPTFSEEYGFIQVGKHGNMQQGRWMRWELRTHLSSFIQEADKVNSRWHMTSKLWKPVFGHTLPF